jgi:endonuclease/exonuclease/phosphatase family metal-dependent hydrolase
VFWATGNHVSTMTFTDNWRTLKKYFREDRFAFAGDLNITCTGRPWPSNKARQTLVEAFDKFELTNTTANIADTVDHIVLTRDFLENKHLEIETWNTDKTLSDHVGLLLTLT